MDNNSKLLYTEICNGFSWARVGNKEFYIKHPTHAEFFSLYTNYDKYLDRAQRAGIRKQKDAISFIIKEGWWSKENEKRISEISDYISLRQTTLSQVNWGNDKKVIEQDILNHRAILESYLLDRRKLTGMVAEEYVVNKLNSDAVLNFFFINCELSQKIEQDIDENVFEVLEKEYNKFLTKFGLSNIKLIAASPFFRSILFLFSEDISGFFGIPAHKMSKFQTDLLTYGKVYQNKIKAYYSDPENKSPIPPDILENEHELIKWAEGNNKILERINRNGEGGSAVFGSPEEVGIKNFGPNPFELAAKNGGSIDLTKI